ncbi:MAG: pyridoxamine 5'-phosphate oxidase family protein [Bacteroidota bacterium]
MAIIDSKIVEFIEEHHVLTLATCNNNKPYCATMFYFSDISVISDNESIEFVFTSDDHTRHVNEALVNKDVAGSIALETSIVGKIQGVQFTGIISKLEDAELSKAKKKYVKRFPIALLATLHLWKINVDFIKLTDNRLGFGKKLIWQKCHNEI